LKKSLPPSFAFGKIHLPRQREARGNYTEITDLAVEGHIMRKIGYLEQLH